MNIKTALLAATVLVALPALASAQSSPSPNNTSGPGISATTPSSTDSGAGAESGNNKGLAERGANSKAQMGQGSTTTGAAPTGASSVRETNQKNESPASMDSGVKQTK